MRIANIVINNFMRDNRVLKIAQTLSDAGHEVVVVALSAPGLPASEQRSGWRVERVTTHAKRLPRGLIFGVAKFLEIGCRMVWQYRRYDAWHCNDVEAFLMGIVAKATRPRLKLIYDCHEFESERNAKSTFERRIVGWVERRFIRFAAHVFTVSPSILAAYHERYDSYGLGSMTLLRNVPHKASRAMSGNRFRPLFSIPSSDLILLYQGAFTFNRGLEQAIDSFAHLPGVHVVFMGYGPLEALVKTACDDTPNYHFHEAVPYEDLLEHTASADVGLVSVKPTCLSYLYCLPNKIFEYIQAGIPVLTNDLPDCAALLNDYGVGRSVMPDTSEEWRAAVAELAENRDLLEEMRQGLPLAQDDLHWAREEQELVRAYSAVSG
jgi:glycosyltransferase involved in cell wall biosynthesis